MKKDTNQAFTLIELIVVIAIIAVIILGVSRINFNSISDKQRLDRIIVTAVSNIETLRNDALLGKSVSLTAGVPESYKIAFSNSGSGNIVLSYLTGGTETIFTGVGKIDFSDKHTSLTTIKCLTLAKPPAITPITNGTGTIQFTGGKMEITSGCPNANEKILEVTIKRKQFSQTIQINTLNGLISVKK